MEIVEARNKVGGVSWGCLGSTYSMSYSEMALSNGMIDGDLDTDAARTCDGHSVVDLGVDRVHTGKLRYYFNSQPEDQAQAYSMGYSADGQNWKRYGDCSCGGGCGNSLGPWGVLPQPPEYWEIDLPTESFRYFDFSTACYDTHIREVQYISSGIYFNLWEDLFEY